jgi:hypothetical protein
LVPKTLTIDSLNTVALVIVTKLKCNQLLITVLKNIYASGFSHLPKKPEFRLINQTSTFPVRFPRLFSVGYVLVAFLSGVLAIVQLNNVEFATVVLVLGCVLSGVLSLMLFVLRKIVRQRVIRLYDQEDIQFRTFAVRLARVSVLFFISFGWAFACLGLSIAAAAVLVFPGGHTSVFGVVVGLGVFLICMPKAFDLRGQPDAGLLEYQDFSRQSASDISFQLAFDLRKQSALLQREVALRPLGLADTRDFLNACSSGGRLASVPPENAPSWRRGMSLRFIGLRKPIKYLAIAAFLFWLMALFIPIDQLPRLPRPSDFFQFSLFEDQQASDEQEELEEDKQKQSDQGQSGNQSGQGQSGSQSGQGQSGNQSGQGQSGNQSGQGQSSNQSGQGQSGNQSGQGQSGNQSGQGQSGNQSGQGQSGNQSDQGQSGSQSGQGQSGNQSGQGQSGNQSGQGQSGNQSGQGQSGDQSGQGQSGNQSGQGQSSNQSGQGQSGNQSGQGQSGNQSGQGQSGNQSGQGQSGNQSDQGQSGNQSGQGQSGSQSGQGQSGNQSGQGQSGNQSGQGQSGNQSVQGQSGNQTGQGQSGNQSGQGQSGNPNSARLPADHSLARVEAVNELAAGTETGQILLSGKGDMTEIGGSHVPETTPSSGEEISIQLHQQIFAEAGTPAKVVFVEITATDAPDITVSPPPISQRLPAWINAYINAN